MIPGCPLVTFLVTSKTENARISGKKQKLVNKLKIPCSIRTYFFSIDFLKNSLLSHHFLQLFSYDLVFMGDEEKEMRGKYELYSKGYLEKKLARESFKLPSYNKKVYLLPKR